MKTNAPCTVTDLGSGVSFFAECPIGKDAEAERLYHYFKARIMHDLRVSTPELLELAHLVDVRPNDKAHGAGGGFIAGGSPGAPGSAAETTEGRNDH